MVNKTHTTYSFPRSCRPVNLCNDKDGDYALADNAAQWSFVVRPLANHTTSGSVGRLSVRSYELLVGQ